MLESPRERTFYFPLSIIICFILFDMKSAVSMCLCVCVCVFVCKFARSKCWHHSDLYYLLSLWRDRKSSTPTRQRITTWSSCITGTLTWSSSKAVGVDTRFCCMIHRWYFRHVSDCHLCAVQETCTWLAPAPEKMDSKRRLRWSGAPREPTA